MVSKPRVTLNQADSKVLGKSVSTAKTKPGKRRAKKDRRKAVADVTAALREKASELFGMLKDMRKGVETAELEKEMLGIFRKLVPAAMKARPQKKEPVPKSTREVKISEPTDEEVAEAEQISVSKKEGPDWISKEEVARLRQIHPVVVLFAPQIPPNTGTVARLCAAMSCELHLIEPLGFVISDKALRRAGLDYWDQLEVGIHKNWQTFREKYRNRRIVVVETGSGNTPAGFDFRPGDVLLFGAETFGVPQELLKEILADKNNQLVTIPMYHRGVRSLNLANTVSIVTYQAVARLHGAPERQ